MTILSIFARALVSRPVFVAASTGPFPASLSMKAKHFDKSLALPKSFSTSSAKRDKCACAICQICMEIPDAILQHLPNDLPKKDTKK
jgi:hypothetical protein